MPRNDYEDVDDYDEVEEVEEVGVHDDDSQRQLRGEPNDIQEDGDE